jgi:hypothetical protein
MAVKVRLSDGRVYVVKGSLDDFTKQRRKALERFAMIEIENDDTGESVFINPGSILSVEAADAAEARLVSAS